MSELPPFTPIHATLKPMVATAARASAVVQSLSPLVVAIAAGTLLLFLCFVWRSVRHHAKSHRAAIEGLLAEVRIQVQYLGSLLAGLESRVDAYPGLLDKAELRTTDRLSEYKHDLALLAGQIANRLSTIQAGIAEHTARQAAMEGRVAEHNEHLSALETRMGEHGAHLSAIRAGGGGLHMG